VGLYEITRRIANTEAGKDQLSFEKAVAMMDAYGGMYRSMHHGRELNRMGISCRMELKYNVQYIEYEDDEDDEG
jgi:hypothetical protein